MSKAMASALRRQDVYKRQRYYQPEGIDAYTMSLDLKPRVVGFAAPQTASADIEDITSKQTEKNGEAR